MTPKAGGSRESTGKGRKRRDTKDVKRKKGGGKAPTGKSGKPRSATKKKVKQATGPDSAGTAGSKPKSAKRAKSAKGHSKSAGDRRERTAPAGAKDGKGGRGGNRKMPGGERGQAGRRSEGGVAGAARAAASVDSDQTPSRIGAIVRRGRTVTAEPIFGPGPRTPIDTGGRDAPRLSEGDLVLLPPPGRDRSGRSRPERVVGRVDNARDVIEALMLDRGLARSFPKQVEAEAEAAAKRVDQSGRVDLRELTTFTIDPTSARDFDDAISAERLDDGRSRVWVHIADVSAFVRPGSLLDEEAIRRSTSTYVPGAVEPMLPHSLSSGACSLVPGEDRLAVTVRMDFDGPGLRRERGAEDCYSLR